MEFDRPNGSPSTRPASWLATAGLVFAGLATGLLAAVLALYLIFGGSSGGAIVLFTLLTLVPAVALGLKGSRLARAYSSGLAACWIAAAGALLLSFDQDQGATPEALDEAKAQILASGAPAYFVGDRADEHYLDDVYLDDACFAPTNPEPVKTDPGCQRRAGKQIAMFWYGESCEAGGEAGCWPSISIQTAPLSWNLSDGACRRLDPVLGVPTVWLDENGSLDGPAIVLFTGSSLVAIVSDDTQEDGDLDQPLELARQLRPLSKSSAVTSLPPPSPDLLAAVEIACSTSPE